MKIFLRQNGLEISPIIKENSKWFSVLQVSANIGASRHHKTTQRGHCDDFYWSFHAERVQLTDDNRISAADIDFLSHLYLMIFKGQSHFNNGAARPPEVGH